MTLFKLLLAAVLISSGSFAFAKKSSSEMSDRAAAFLLHQIDSQQTMSMFSLKTIDDQGDSCKPGYSGECVEFVAGSYPNSDERLQAARACVGNHGAACVIFTAGSYPNFGERITAAKACRNVIDAACVEFVAGSYPNSSERLEAAKACENADVECVKYTAGSYPNSSERIAAAKACGGL